MVKVRKGAWRHKLVHAVTAGRVHKIRSWVRSIVQVGESAWECGGAWVASEKWVQRGWKRVCRWTVAYWGRQQGMLQMAIMRALKVIISANQLPITQIAIMWPWGAGMARTLWISHDHHLFSVTETSNRYWTNRSQNGRHRAQNWEYKII